MTTVFISYRRGETAGEARALFNQLVTILGRDSVFMDVDTIAPGRDFRQVISERLESCDQVLALVGRDWIDARAESGQRRLDDPNDLVRAEIRAALKRAIPVTPVLVQGARMPSAEQLPEDIRDFAYRHAFALSHDRWESDVRELLKRLGADTPPNVNSIVGTFGGGKRLRHALLLAGTAGIVITTYFVVWAPKPNDKQTLEQPGAGPQDPAGPPATDIGSPRGDVQPRDRVGQVPNNLLAAKTSLEGSDNKTHFAGIKTLDGIFRASPEHGEEILLAVVSYIRRVAAIQPTVTAEKDEKVICEAPLSWPQVQSRGSVRPDAAKTIQAGLALIGTIVNLNPKNSTLIDLNNVDLSGMSLESMNLEGARLWGSLFRNSRLANARLGRADLRRSDLAEADLQDANLEGATLWGAHLRGTKLNRAKLQQADLRKVDLSKALLVGAQLQRAYVWHSNIREAVMTDAELNGADLGGADLTDASLEGADLREAKLWYGAPCVPQRATDLTRARLAGAKLTGAALDAAILTDAIDLTQEQLRGAKTNSNTVLPRGMRPN